MDPFDRFQFDRRKVNLNAIIAFVVAVLAAWVIQQMMGFYNSLFTTLIVVAVGGLWYHIRRVV